MAPAIVFIQRLKIPTPFIHSRTPILASPTSSPTLLLSEKGELGLEDIARGVHAKLVRRHPHVFGGTELDTPGEVRRTWESSKRDLEGRAGIFHDVPESLPALLYARKVQRRAAAVDFEYPDTAGALADLDDEVRELKEALSETGEIASETETPAHVFAEMGHVLFAAVTSRGA